MANSRQKLPPGATVIDHLASLDDFAHGRLQGNAIEPQAFAPALPPMAFGFENLSVLRFRDAVAFARFDQYFPIDGAIVQQRRHFFSYSATAAVCGMGYGYDGHGQVLLSYELQVTSVLLRWNRGSRP